MNIKRIPAIVLCAVLAAAGCIAFGACKPTTRPGEEAVDPNRTQIYVYNFYGGYGSDWLAAAKTRFEEKHKDDTNWEEGKQGVQVIIRNKKEAVMGISSQILANTEEVYFTEYAYYYTLLGEGVLGDISEAVTQPLSEYGEEQAIADKLSAEQRAYFGVQEEDGTHYYGLPHYAGYSGLIYNVDLFDEEGYYFAKTPSDNTRDGRFIDSFNTQKSAGPDGVEGTFDDGLPATYEEFFTLCDYIYDGGTTPVIWNGEDYWHYLNNLVQALQADYEGLDQTMLNYTLNGNAETLATVSGGSVSLEPSTPVTEADAYELARQAGKYYGLSFLEELIKNDHYHNSLAFNTTYSFLNAQEDFLYGGNDGQTKPAAMLCDGVWWEMEAKETFDAMVAQRGDDYSKYNRSFAFMPLPKATQAEVDEAAAAYQAGEAPYTLYDGIYSMCFMKANVAEWKKPLILDFIRFVHSDQSLVEFTTVTNTLKAFNYSIEGEAYEALTPFGQSLVRLKDASEVVYPVSTNATYVQNQSFFGTHDQFRSETGRGYQFPALAMHDDNVTAADYFAGMAGYYKKNWVVK